MDTTGPYSPAQIHDALRIQAATVSFPLPLHSRRSDIQRHFTTLTKTPPNSTVLSV